uniref:Early endosome antigen n=1 Tax=Rhizophora mucronata TaxID=61149 RepID=A0A2P2NI84_RHIMU
MDLLTILEIAKRLLISFKYESKSLSRLLHELTSTSTGIGICIISWLSISLQQTAPNKH